MVNDVDYPVAAFGSRGLSWLAEWLDFATVPTLHGIAVTLLTAFVATSTTVATLTTLTAITCWLTILSRIPSRLSITIGIRLRLGAKNQCYVRHVLFDSTQGAQNVENDEHSNMR